MLRPLALALALGLSGCASVNPLAGRKHAETVALAYLTSHHAPLPQDYTVTVEERDYSPESGHFYAIYGVDIRGRDQRTRGVTYTVVVNRRTFEVDSFVNNSGLPMPWMYEDYVRNHHVR